MAAPAAIPTIPIKTSLHTLPEIGVAHGSLADALTRASALSSRRSMLIISQLSHSVTSGCVSHQV